MRVLGTSHVASSNIGQLKSSAAGSSGKLAVSSISCFIKKFVFIVCFSVLVTAMKKYQPTDATTNPSLILLASQKPQYDQLINDAIDYAKHNARLF